jgi:tetratricopeptide (TPR) repeat protein/transcriptional regulator with XRE-family HTH domain
MDDDATAAGAPAEFGGWVRRRRKERLLTQEDLAERARVSVRTVQMIESGRVAGTRAATRRQLIEALGDEPAASAAPDGDPPAGRVVPAQLPCDTGVFTGRADHLAALDALLASPPGESPRAVIISAVSGTAGVGKTTLAVHWAHRVGAGFPDGQLYVNLRGFDPAGEPVAPAEAIRGFLDALGVPADRMPPDLDAQVVLYRSLIAGKRILVILDNARDAAQVRPLLPGAGGAFALITSRSRLTPLVAAEGATVVRLDLLPAAEARELLASRLGGDRLAAEPEATDRILAACAGLPLALSIAAARATQTGFPLSALAAELHTAGNRLAALDAGDPATQVGTVFSWSYAALGPDAARLFRLLGPEPTPHTADAVAALAGLPAAETRRLVTELIQASLLTEHTPGRYSMHDLLRAYAADLARTRDSAPARRAATIRLLDHYTHTAHAASRQLYPHRDPIPLPLRDPAPGSAPEDFATPAAATRWLAGEHPVLLAALRHAAAAGFDRHAWWLAWCLDTFLYRQGHWHALAAAWEAGLRAAGRLGSPAAEAYAHRRFAHPANRFGRYAEARAHIGTALELYTSIGDVIGQADAHSSLAPIWDLEGEYAEALRHVEQSAALYRTAGHRRGEAVSLANIGWFRARLGDPQSALAYCEPTLDMFRQLGDRTGEAGNWYALGYIRHLLGRYAEAADSHRRALELYRDIGDRYNEAGTLARLGDTYRAAGDVAAARDVLRQALVIFTDLGHDEAGPIRATLGDLVAAETGG